TSPVEAGRRGAFDYIVAPVDDAVLSGCVNRAAAQLDARRFGPKAKSPKAPVAFIGTSAPLVETLDAVDRVAHSMAPVLLLGETGTGKDILAARIHSRGPRRHRPYVVVNAAAIPAGLLDSELFGHVAGASLGGTRARRGLVTEADGGTLFLDEIADLSVKLQGRLLRVLESGSVRALGADHEHPVDVRFIAATQRNLTRAVREGSFREDLYFRLNVLVIRVPALRDRREDLPALIDYFFENARARNPRSPVHEISPAVYQQLLRAAWPGNVRELQGLIERLVVFGKGKRVETRDLAVACEPVAPADGSSRSGGELLSLRDMTRRYVESVLVRTRGDKPRAASILGIDVSTLYRWQRRRPSE
ncbi:MAG: Response regulator of zinc sigma-54-dependent two-component system, partial [Labilithrix sp.]|nr:Response regulator of zinc sigma-54-dependent two-component system [Labilithrix sp.]